MDNSLSGTVNGTGAFASILIHDGARFSSPVKILCTRGTDRWEDRAGPVRRGADVDVYT